MCFPCCFLTFCALHLPSHCLVSILFRPFCPFVSQGIVGILASRHDELHAALAANPTCTPFLRDFDWKLNLTLSSDKAASLNAPVLLLSLNIAQPLSDAERAQDAHAGEERHVVELTQPELAKFVAQLEAMNAAMAGL